MKSAIISILIGLFAGTASWQAFQLIHDRKAQEQANAYINYNTLIEEDIRTIIEQIPINLCEIPIFSNKGDSLTLADVIPECGAHILRYSAIGCKPCFKKALDSIYSYIDENGFSKPVIILVSQSRPRDLKVLSATHSNRFQFYGINSFPFDYEAESISPMIFDVDSTGHVTDFSIVTIDDNQP